MSTATLSRPRTKHGRPKFRDDADRAEVLRGRILELMEGNPKGLSLARLTERACRANSLRGALRDRVLAELVTSGTLARWAGGARGAPSTWYRLAQYPEPPPPERSVMPERADRAAMAAIRAEGLAARAGSFSAGAREVKQRYFANPHPTRWAELSHADASRLIRRMYRKRDPRLFAERFGTRPGDDHNTPGRSGGGGLTT